MTVAAEVVRTFEAACQMMANDRMVALDLETGGLNPWRDQIHVITLYGDVSQTPVVLHYPAGERVPQDVLDWLASFDELVTHNGIAFDMQFLVNAGMDIYKPKIYDTMIGEMSVLLTGRRDSRVNLADTAKRRLGKTLDKTVDHAGWALPDLSPEHLAYVLGDISHLIDLRQSQFDRAREIDAEPWRQGQRKTEDCLDFEMRLARPMMRMKQRGMPVDLDRVNEYLDQQGEKLRKAKETLWFYLGNINLNSNPQLMTALAQTFNECELPENKEDYRLLQFPNTQADTLHVRAQLPGDVGEVAQALLDYRYIAKRKSMYGGDDFQKNMAVWHDDHYRVHGTIWQNGTNTGRMSSSNPNMQQIPKDMRMCFGNRPGYWIGKTDYAAIEVRVAASLAKDQHMIQSFKDGRDIHRVVGAAGFGKTYEEVTKEERQIAKAMSFTLLFGGSVETFRTYAAHNGSSIDRRDAEEAVNKFYDQFSGIEDMRRRAIREIQKAEDEGKPKEIRFPSGLKRQLVGAERRPTVLLNNIVQGTAGCGLKKALILMEEAGIAEHLCAVVHDEVVYEAEPEELPRIREVVEECMIQGMHWALEGEAEIPIGVESTWGETWAGDKQNINTREW